MAVALSAMTRVITKGPKGITSRSAMKPAVPSLKTTSSDGALPARQASACWPLGRVRVEKARAGAIAGAAIGSAPPVVSRQACHSLSNTTVPGTEIKEPFIHGIALVHPSLTGRLTVRGGPEGAVNPPGHARRFTS